MKDQDTAQSNEERNVTNFNYAQLNVIYSKLRDKTITIGLRKFKVIGRFMDDIHGNLELTSIGEDHGSWHSIDQTLINPDYKYYRSMSIHDKLKAAQELGIELLDETNVISEDN